MLIRLNEAVGLWGCHGAGPMGAIMGADVH